MSMVSWEIVYNSLTAVGTSVRGLVIWPRLYGRKTQKWDQVFWLPNSLQKVVQITNGI